GVPFIPGTLYLFSRRILNRDQSDWVEKAGFILAGLFSVVALMAPQKIYYIVRMPWGWEDEFKGQRFGTPYFVALMAFFLFYFTKAYVNILSGYRTAASPPQRKHFRLILIALSISYLGLFDFVVTRGINIYPTGYITLTIFTTMIAYSVGRYQLWSINFA